MNKIPYLDLRIRDQQELNGILSSIERVLRHGILIMGPELSELEEKVAAYCNRKYAIGVASGTDALFLTFRALGLKHGDEVITNSYSWIATANAIHLTGAVPVFADILPDLTLDPHSVKKMITGRTKAILAVNYSGRVCDYDKLSQIARDHKLHLIEDASQSFGARRQEKIAGSFGEISCISLNPMKLFGACGEAGIILTDSQKIKAIIEVDRYNGMENKIICNNPGVNSRMDTLQAAILLYRLKNFSKIIKRRREIALLYNEKFKRLGITVFEDGNEILSSYFSYFIGVDNREALLEHLESNGVECKLRDSDYLPGQPAYQNCKADTPNAKRLFEKLVLLPASEALSNDQVNKIINEVTMYIRGIDRNDS